MRLVPGEPVETVLIGASGVNICDRVIINVSALWRNRKEELH